MTTIMNGEPFLSIQAADHTSNEAATGSTQHKRPQLSLSEDDEDEDELATAFPSFGAGLTFLGEGRQRSAG